MSLDPEFVTALMAFPETAERITYLQAAGLLNAAGLDQLIDWAGSLVRRDPGQGQQLAGACLEIAQSVGIPTAVPRAAYLKAQTHALAGELDAALELVETAYNAYKVNGQEQQALATNIGRMHILAEMGQYQQALDAGQIVLEQASSYSPAELLATAAQAAQNMGLCHRRLGQYEAALRDYDTAESYFQSLSLPERVGDISNNRGVLLMEIGRVAEAVAALESALEIRTKAGQSFLQGQTLNNLGSAHLLLGSYTESLAFFEQARQLFAAQEETLDQHILLLDTARAYLTLNLYADAVTAFQEAEQALAAAGAEHHRIQALSGLGAALSAQGNLAQAEHVLATAVTLLQTPANPLLATLLLEQAALQTAQSRNEEAVATANQALRLALNNDWLLPALYAQLRLSDLHLDDLPQAERYLTAARLLIESLGLPHLRYRWLERFGRLRRRQGRDDQAQQLLEAAVTEIEQLRGSLAQETFRPSFLQDKMMAYDELVHLYLERGDPDSLQQAFLVTEQAKSRALADLMSGVVSAQISAENERLQQLEQLQANLNALYNEMLASGTSGERHIHLAGIQAQAAEIEKQISQHHLQAAAASRIHGGLAAPFSSATLPPEIPGGIALLSYYCLGDDLIAFVSDGGEMSIRRRMCRVSDVRRALERLNIHLGRFRIGGAFISQHLPTLERTAKELFGRLYDLVFAPLESLLADKKDLTIIPHGPLHHLPFPALFDGRVYLLERFEISYAPSTAVFMLCRSRQPAQSRKTLVMGVSDPTIPAVRKEVAAVAAHNPEAAVYLNEAATLTTLRTQSPGSAVLHLACHGFFRADNPMFSAIRLHDGWLTAVQAMQLELDGALVTLSGCDTGMNQVINGDELLGLTRGFLGAGAAGLIVSLWLAQDETTAELMSTLYEKLQCEQPNRAAALRQAQLALKETHPHPYYWAPFILVGQRTIPTIQ